MSESSAWATLRGSLKSEASHGSIDIQRFEDKVAFGIPDANICYLGKEIWLEGKFIEELPKRLTTTVKIKLSNEQCTWLENRQRAHGNVFVWVRVTSHGWLLIDADFRECQKGLLWEDMVNRFELFKTSKEMARELLRV